MATEQMIESQEKLPLNITFEIVQDFAPNDHWYTVTPVLSWEQEEFLQRMDSGRCLHDEISTFKEGICFLMGKRFDIREVKEQVMPHLIKDLPLGKKAWASPLAAFLDDGSLAVALDDEWECVPTYGYPRMLFVWHRADGFYIAEKTSEEEPTCFVKAQLVAKSQWASYLEAQRREAVKQWYRRL